MFHFPAFASNPLWIQGSDTLILQLKMPRTAVGSLPRRHLATPVAEGGFPHSEILGSKLVRSSPGLSQRTTSFIASQRQGIHQMPFFHLIALIVDARHMARGLLLPLPIKARHTISHRPPSPLGRADDGHRPSNSRDMSIRPRCGQTPRSHRTPPEPLPSSEARRSAASNVPTRTIPPAIACRLREVRTIGHAFSSR